MIVYCVSYSDGTTSRDYTTLDEAEEAVSDEFPDGVIDRKGDLRSGGDRTLFWSDEESAKDDNGAHALGAIKAVNLSDNDPYDGE